MNLNRGDIALVRFPHDSGGRGKKRPVVVVQADVYNRQLRHSIVAEITSNLSMANDPSNLLIDLSSPENQRTGLTQNSVVTCWHLLTMNDERIGKVIGVLSATMMQKVDLCLKAALQLS